MTLPKLEIERVVLDGEDAEVAIARIHGFLVARVRYEKTLVLHVTTSAAAELYGRVRKSESNAVVAAIRGNLDRGCSIELPIDVDGPFDGEVWLAANPAGKKITVSEQTENQHPKIKEENQ